MLQPIGVCPADEAVYRELLNRAEATADDLAVALARPVDDVDGSLTTLEGLGLVTRLPGRPARRRAARPDVAIDVLVSRRQQELARAQLEARELPSLLPVEERHRPEDLVEVVVGRDAIAARFEQLLRDTRSELLVLDRPPYVADRQRSDTSVRSLMRAEVEVRGVYAPEALELPGALEEAQDAALAGERSRVHSDVPMKLAISDRRSAILPVGTDEVIDGAFCIRPSSLLDAVVQLFELLWSQGTPVMPTPEDSSGDRELVGLLALGAKDEVIARHLDVSTRTLSRRIARLMDDLNVRTRFQAGVQAVRRGWLSRDDERPDDGLLEFGPCPVRGPQP